MDILSKKWRKIGLFPIFNIFAGPPLPRKGSESVFTDESNKKPGNILL